MIGQHIVTFQICSIGPYPILRYDEFPSPHDDGEGSINAEDDNGVGSELAHARQR